MRDQRQQVRAQNFRLDQGGLAVIICAVCGNTFLARWIPAVSMLRTFPVAVLIKQPDRTRTLVAIRGFRRNPGTGQSLAFVGADS